MEQVEYSVTGNVAHIVLNNPERLNAIGPAMATGLLAALESAAGDDEVRVVLLSGAGRAFCAGGDLSWMAEGLAVGDLGMSGLVGTLGRVAVLVRTMPKPVIASVHRAAAGAGMGLALLADFCLASDDTRFSTAFSTLGLASDTGVAFVLTRTLGHLRATDLLMSGRRLTAAEAERLGLITQVVPAADLNQTTVDFLAGLLTGPAAAFAAIKQQVWATQFAGFAEYLALEGELQGGLAASDEFAQRLGKVREGR